jgi:hypothetical protein
LNGFKCPRKTAGTISRSRIVGVAFRRERLVNVNDFCC